MQPKHLKKSLLALAMGSMISQAAQAVVLVVDNSGDDGEGCTFRDAVVSITNGASEPGCRATVSAFGTRDSIRFSVPTVNLTSEVLIQKDLIINPFTIDEPITLTGNGNDRLLRISNATVTINKITLSGGRTVPPQSGGGMYITNSTVTLTNSTIQDNRSRTLPDFVVLGLGGGVFSQDSELTLINSTVTGNSSAQSGGGVYSRYSQLNVINSTVSGNTGAGGGAGIHIGVNASMNMVNSTVSNNTETYGNGGGINLSGYNSSASISNSIVIGNQVTRASRSGHEISSPSSTLISSQSNLLGVGSRALNNVQLSASDVAVDLSSTALSSVISLLANNGGSTLTHALPRNSPAINAGDASLCAAEPINNLDQRGEPRDDNCDIGAFEFIEEDGTFFVIPTANGKNVIVEL